MILAIDVKEKQSRIELSSIPVEIKLVRFRLPPVVTLDQ